MSNSMAIAATTAALHSLLTHEIPRRDGGLVDLSVTTQPPDRARTGITTSQLNVFLYQTSVNAAWRNMDPPGRVKPGETGFPPLALNLYYLLTAYGRGDADNDAVSHRVLGGAMSVLHDHPLLGADELRQVMAGNDLADQIERVRITPQPFSLDEISKLWTAFSTNYRLSAAYEATVVLIDSLRPTFAALPVLTRGPLDDNAEVNPHLRLPFPELAKVELDPQTPQPSVRLGNTLKLTGSNLSGSRVEVLFRHARSTDPPVARAATIISPTTITTTLPNDHPEAWPAGVYSTAVAVENPDPAHPGQTERRLSNEIPITVAPEIRVIGAGPAQHSNGLATLDVTITSFPEVRSDQRVVLLAGPYEYPLRAPLAAQGNTLRFHLAAIAPGPYYLRLRVDGVDSLLVADYTARPPAFDAAQRIMVP